MSAVMHATVRHADGEEWHSVAAYPDHTPAQAYDYMLQVLASSGQHPVGDPDTLTVTTHTPTVQVVRRFTGGEA